MREGHAVAHAPDAEALDRSPQILPVPLGGLTPARRPASDLLRSWRRHRSAALAVMAVAAICIAVWVSTDPRSFTVAASSDVVRVDAIDLSSAGAEPVDGTRLFTGEAALAITAGASGTTHAGAVMTWNGLTATGRCTLHVLGRVAVDACVFTTGMARLTSVDTFDFGAHVWRRHYRDGVDVTIAVPVGSDLIPIPFPLGR